MELTQTRIGPHRSRGGTIGNALLIFAGGLLVVSSVLKFAAIPPIAKQMAAAGFAGGKLTFLAALEMFCASLFLWPRTRSIGILLVSSYLGGAICTHVAVGEYTKCVPPAVILSLAWIGTSLRHPQMFWSFKSSSNLNSHAIHQPSQLIPSRVG